MILITGGAGFIGAAMVRALTERGEEVRVLDNFSGGHTMLEGIEYINGDVRLLADVVKAMDGCDEVIHLAAINGTPMFYSYPGLVLDVAVKGITNLLEACWQHQVKQFMLMSSSEVCRA